MMSRKQREVVAAKIFIFFVLLSRDFIWDNLLVNFQDYLTRWEVKCDKQLSILASLQVYT